MNNDFASIHRKCTKCQKHLPTLGGGWTTRKRAGRPFWYCPTCAKTLPPKQEKPRGQAK